ncbi:MAG: hypothetical protein U1A27_06375 [Phycisphaerae bacterium]
MAVGAGGKSAGSAGFSAERRFSIGLNVAVAVAAAVLLVVFVNWFASMREYRRDISSLGSFSVSERTRSVLAQSHADIRVSVLYSRDDAAKDPTRYVDRVLDYCDELRRVAPEVKVEYMPNTAPTRRAQLIGRLTGTLGGEATEHKKVLDEFTPLADELLATFAKEAEAARQIQANADAWLGDFPVFTDIANQLNVFQDRVRKTKEQVRQLSGATGVPKYPDATSKISTDFTLLKTDLQTANKAMGRLAELSAALGKPGAPQLAPLKQVATALPALIEKLRQVIGNAGDPLPGDLRATLKAYADEGEKIDKEIQRAVQDVDQLAHDYPAIAEHVMWSIQSPVGGGLMMQLPMTKLLSSIGAQFGELRLQILSVLDRNDSGKLEQAVKRLRDFTTRLKESIDTACSSLGALAERITRVDPASAAVLASAKAGFLADVTQKVEKMLASITKLPALKLATVADDIKEENVIVVESNDRVRVLKFDQVWPVRVAISDAASAGDEQNRVFNGDAAVYSALLGLTREKPFATVVFVHYEPKQEQRSFMAPPRPPVPMGELSELRKRLEESSFAVKEWELSSADPAPAPEEGTVNLYVFLPPTPPAPPNPFGGPQPKPFGEAEMKKVRDALGKDARAVFLMTWDVIPGGPFGGGFSSPKYVFADYLRDEWGVTVQSDHRITWVIPDNKRPDQISVNAERFTVMPLNYFTDNPIGKPFQTSAVKLTDVCALKAAANPPAGVRIEPVLEVPDSEEFIAADVQQLVRVINEVLNPQNAGIVPRVTSTLAPPWGVMLAARNEKDGRQIVAFSGARSLTDGLLTRSQVKQVGERIVAEPPPIGNVDLFVNSLYWLLGQEKLIAAGPPAAPTIKPIDGESMAWLRVTTYGIWPALMFAPGLYFWLARRR